MGPSANGRLEAQSNSNQTEPHFAGYVFLSMTGQTSPRGWEKCTRDIFRARETTEGPDQPGNIEKRIVAAIWSATADA